MFTRMDQSTKQEWEHISEQHMPHIFDMPNRIMGMLKQLQGLTLGFSTDQLHHALQPSGSTQYGLHQAHEPPGLYPGRSVR